MDTALFILKILGSLGVFLYGMKVMSEGIQRTAGDRMRKIMAKMTHNRVAGVTTGVLTTGLLQSSSATTVMTVSFVNAGLLTLVESVGIMMGANLGTTLTAWIIAAVGKFSISNIAIPIIGIGLPIFFIGKNRVKSFGEVLIGFGLLFYGLYLLKESVPDINAMLSPDANPDDRALALTIEGWIESVSGLGYGSILIFLTIGVLLTLMVQSSSAAMAITVTLAIQGWIGFHESAAIVLGENIGTTVTAELAAIGTSVNARRSARSHTLFNVIGVGWMLIAFIPFTHVVLMIGELLPESFRTEKHATDIGFNLAIFHSLFNFTNILLLIGFVPLIAKFVTRWVKDPETDQKRPRLRFISQSMLNVGELNIPEAENATRELADLTREMFQGYVEVFSNPDRDLTKEVKRIKALEDEADVLTHDITEYLVRTSASEITDENALSVTRMLRNVAELEEISDIIYRLIQVTQRKYTKQRDFTDEATQAVLDFANKVLVFIDLYNHVLEEEPTEEKMELARQLEKETDSLRKQGNKQAMKRMATEEGVVKTEMLTIDMNNQFEAIGNHALNVVQNAYYDAFEDEVPDKFDD